MSEPNGAVRISLREVYDLLVEVDRKVTSMTVEMALHRWLIGLLLAAIVGLSVKVVVG